jgi:hypothetical protein
MDLSILLEILKLEFYNLYKEATKKIENPFPIFVSAYNQKIADLRILSTHRSL